MDNITVAILIVLTAVVLIQLYRLERRIMADFTALNTSLAKLEADVAALVAAGQVAGQPAVDAVTARVDAIDKTVTDATAALTPAP